MPMLACHDEADGNDKDLAVAMCLFGARRTVTVGLSRVVLPSALRLDDIAAGALQPFREAHGNKTPSIRIVILSPLKRHRGRSESLDAELFLEARLADDLWVCQSRRGEGSIPFLEPRSDARDGSSTCSEVHDGTGTKGRNDCASPQLLQLILHAYRPLPSVLGPS